MSTENAIETEVKIPVPHWTSAEAHQRLAALHFAVCAPRIFEANAVFDTPNQSVRGGQMLLRLRRVGDRNILTWKGPTVYGTHKSRPELEVTFSSFDTMRQILEHLGYATYFRYEKYRTEFTGREAGTVTFDETPIGNFVELEGHGRWIDETAVRLGFSQSDYVLESYGRLYLAHCSKLGVQPSDMLFPSTS
jgi:adenylate cyclase class 2